MWNASHAMPKKEKRRFLKDVSTIGSKSLEGIALRGCSVVLQKRKPTLIPRFVWYFRQTAEAFLQQRKRIRKRKKEDGQTNWITKQSAQSCGISQFQSIAEQLRCRQRPTKSTEQSFSANCTLRRTTQSVKIVAKNQRTSTVGTVSVRCKIRYANDWTCKNRQLNKCTDGCLDAMTSWQRLFYLLCR